jgi:hypothetical protein
LSYQEKLAQDRRLLILQALDNAAGYTAASRLLLSFLESMGNLASSDQLEGDLAWLQEQGMIEVQAGPSGSIAMLKARGADIVSGRARHPGIRRPAVGEA